MEIINTKDIFLKPKIKPLIGFTSIDLKCDTQLDMMCLARDRPKMISQIKTTESIEKEIGNKGIRQLCQTFQDTKKVQLNVCQCDAQQSRILAKWVRTSRNLKKLELVFPWQITNPNKILLCLKDVKNLEDLSLIVSRKEVPNQLKRNSKSLLKLHYLRNLKKLKIGTANQRRVNSMNNLTMLNALKGLGQLCELDLDLSFCDDLSDKEVQKFMSFLKEIKNLSSLRLDLSKCSQLEETLTKELASYLVKLKTLQYFQLKTENCSSLNPERVERLGASIGNNSNLKTLVLATSFRFIPNNKARIQFLNLMGINQLLSLKLVLGDFSGGSRDSLFQDLAKSLKNNLRLENFDISLSIWPLNLQNFQSLSQGLETLKNLSSLKLSLTDSLDFQSENIYSLTRSIKTLKRLTSFSLTCTDCFLPRKSVVMIAECISSLENLKKLVLDFSFSRKLPKSCFRRNDSKRGLADIGRVLQGHKDLSKLNLNFMDIDICKEELEEFASGIGFLKSLKSFEFSFGSLKMKESSFTGLESLYKSLENLPLLSRFSFQCSRMSEKNLKSLFLTLEKMKTLTDVEMDFEKVEIMKYEMAHLFIEMIRSLKKLTRIDFNFHWCLKKENQERFLNEMKKHFLSSADWRNSKSEYIAHSYENILSESFCYIIYHFPIRYRNL